MDRRDMRRSDWRRITRRRYVCRPFEAGGFSGAEALIMIDAVTEPLRVAGRDGDVVIADVGYKWFQIAPRGRYFWLTVMFDERNELVQMYFDITGGCEFSDPENPTFEDMYLDFVVSPDGDIRSLDEDDLDAALDAGQIDRAQYDAARAHGKALLEWLLAHRFELMDYCRRALEEMLDMIE